MDSKFGNFYNNGNEPPYSQEDYEDAKSKGLDLDNWRDYKEYYQLGKEPEEY